MSILLVSISLVTLAILEKSFFGFPLVAPLALAFSFQLEARQSFFLAFSSGLLVSLVEGSPLGQESLALLGACGLVHLYGRRFSTRHWFFFGVFAILGSVVYLLGSGRRVGIWQVVLQTFLIIFFLLVRRRIWERFFPEAIIVKV